MERLGMRTVGLLAAAAALLGIAAFGALRVAGSDAEPQMIVETQVGSDGTVRIQIEADGLEAGAEYLARLYSVDAEVSASAGQLGRVVADRDGHAELSATSAVIGAGAEVPLTVDLFADGGRLVALVSADGDDAASVHVQLLR